MKFTKYILAFICLGATFGSLNAQEVSDREIIALLELKARTNGENWTHKWDQTKPVRTWYGITVEDGKVVGLELSNNNLVGNLPLTIGNLRNLRVLDLSNNKLEGRIPVELRKFNHLLVADLSGNHFKGKIPSTINRLKKLKEFNLANNQLSGELPNSLTELEQLENLVLTNNKLEGKMPLGMEQLKNLKGLYLANNNFNDLNNLKTLASQQIILTDIAIEKNGFKQIDFSKTESRAAKLKFSDLE